MRRLRIKRTEQLETEGRKAIGFYREGGKTRPITKKKPRKTRVVKKVVPAPTSAHIIRDASNATRTRFDKAVKGHRYATDFPGFHLDSDTVVALLINVDDVLKGPQVALVDFVKRELGGIPDASYPQITSKSLGASIPGASDPQDKEWIYIGDTVYGKEPLKVALRTLGGRNIRIYSMGKDSPVFLMNDADEAVIIAPATPDEPEAYLRLEEVGKTKTKPRKTRSVQPRTPVLPQIQQPQGARRNAHGWDLDFPSSSSPGTVYKTTFWTEDYKQFKEGDITCNCPGWRFKRTCRHVKEVEQMAGVRAYRNTM